MSMNSFGHLFRVTTWGESHGPALGCVVDGCPPGVPLAEADIQPWLDDVLEAMEDASSAAADAAREVPVPTAEVAIAADAAATPAKRAVSGA